MVAGHGKLGMLLLDDEVVQLLLLGELVAEADAVVIDAETDDNGTRVRNQGEAGFVAVAHVLGFVGGLPERGGQLVVVVADGGCLAPDGAPRLVELAGLLVHDLEAGHQAGFRQVGRGVLVPGQFQAEVRGQHDGTVLVVHLVGWAAVLIDREFQLDVAVRRHNCG